MADVWTAPSGPAAGVSSRAEMISQRTDNVDAMSRAIDGDVSASTIKHRHKVGTLAARPTPGESGRIYLPSDISLMVHDDGTEWHIGQAFPTNCAHFFDEFALGVDANGDLKWKNVIAAGGAIAQVDTHGGAVQFDTGGIAASTVRMISNTVGGGDLNPAKIHLQFIILKSNHAANTIQNLIAGMVDTMPAGTTDPTDGIYLKKSSNGNWFGICRASSTETTQDMGGTFASETVVIIERTSTGVKFYRDTWNAGGLQGSEITTNIPTATLLPGFRADNTGIASSRAITVNAYGLWSAR